MIIAKMLTMDLNILLINCEWMDFEPDDYTGVEWRHWNFYNEDENCFISFRGYLLGVEEV